jgi:hypothetical protein
MFRDQFEQTAGATGTNENQVGVQFDHGSGFVLICPA